MAPELAELFEVSSPLARRLAAAGPHPDLVAAARRLVPQLTEEEKVQTLNAHPRIGERPANMSARSRAEQGDDVLPELERLNREYESRFGFRFVVFVNGRPKAEIVEVMRRRLGRSREEEMADGLQAIVDIAASRLRS